MERAPKLEDIIESGDDHFCLESVSGTYNSWLFKNVGIMTGKRFLICRLTEFEVRQQVPVRENMYLIQTSGLLNVNFPCM